MVVTIMSKKIEAIDAAVYFVRLANQSAENDLTNLKLQKILYLAQGTLLGKDQGLFNDDIEAWPLGPVVRSVYDTFSFCGASPITLLDIPDSTSEIESSISSKLDSAWKKYGKYSASYLVKLTHKQAPWKQTYESGSRKVIPKALMEEYFKSTN